MILQKNDSQCSFLKLGISHQTLQFPPPSFLLITVQIEFGSDVGPVLQLLDEQSSLFPLLTLVAIDTQVLGVGLSLGVSARGSHLVPTFDVVAVIAHTLGVILVIKVRTLVNNVFANLLPFFDSLRFVRASMIGLHIFGKA